MLSLRGRRGTQFTCFTSTKVQILTQKALLGPSRFATPPRNSGATLTACSGRALSAQAYARKKKSVHPATNVSVYAVARRRNSICVRTHICPHIRALGAGMRDTSTRTATLNFVQNFRFVRNDRHAQQRAQNVWSTGIFTTHDFSETFFSPLLTGIREASTRTTTRASGITKTPFRNQILSWGRFSGFIVATGTRGIKTQVLFFFDAISTATVLIASMEASFLSICVSAYCFIFVRIC